MITSDMKVAGRLGRGVGKEEDLGGYGQSKPSSYKKIIENCIS